MNKFLFSLILSATAFTATAADEMLRITRGTVNDYVPVSAIDSIYYDADGKTMYFKVSGNEEPLTLVRSEINCIECIAKEDCPTSISVTYNDSKANIENPFLLSGVTAEADGAYVTLYNTNTTTELTTELSGSTTNGAFTYEGEYKTTIVLNGVSITSQKGAAIDIQCGKRIAMELKKGTTNTLTDAANGEQKAALYCKGHLEIDKAGTLNVTGNTAHAISAKEYIQLKKADGAINILSAKNDGIHCGQYFLANGYTVTVAGVAGDGIQAELRGDTDYAEDFPDGSLNIQGGTFSITCDGDDAGGLKADAGVNINSLKSVPAINITMNGAASKGIKADDILTVEAGDITITNNGTGGTFDNEVYTSKCLSSDTDIKLLGGNITLTATGNGGKCAKADGSIYLGNQTTPDALVLTASTTGGSYSGTTSGSSSGGSTGGNNWGGNRPGGGGGGFPGRPGGSQDGQSDGTSSPKALKAIKNIIVYGGSTTTTTKGTGGEGWEGKTGVTISGGNHYFKCYDDCINSAGIINFAGGNSVCYATNNDAVDSNYGRTGAITISGGNVFAYTSAGSPEEGLDCDNNSYITITGGIAISAGGSQGGGGGSSASVGSASQGYYLGSSPSSYNTSNYYTLCSTSGTPICTYKFEGTVSNTLSLLTAPNLGKGSVTVKAGTAEPTSCTSKVLSTTGKGVFYIAPTVTTTTTSATVTAK